MTLISCVCSFTRFVQTSWVFHLPAYRNRIQNRIHCWEDEGSCCSWHRSGKSVTKAESGRTGNEVTTDCKTDAGPSGRTIPSLTPIDNGHLMESCPWGGSAHGDTWAHRLANPDSGLRWGLAASLPMSSSRFILLGVRRGERSTHFYILRLFQALSDDNCFSPATTPHSNYSD